MSHLLIDLSHGCLLKLPALRSSCPSPGSRTEEQENPQERWSKYYERYRYVAPSQRDDFVKLGNVPAKECGSAPDFEGFFKLDYTTRSRLDEDKYIYEQLFKGKNVTHGTFIELGAYNGAQESNSMFFEKCLGWEGLLLEGNPENYQKVVANRPFAHKMKLAPSCSAEYERENKTIQFYKYPITNVGLPGFAKTYEGKPTVEVPCGPLTPVLLDIFKDKPVLFFSLDVEGAENLVLQTLDFSKVQIHVLMIEIQNDNCRAREPCLVRSQVRERMKAEGYKRYERLVHQSDIYIHPESPYQISESVAKPQG